MRLTQHCYACGGYPGDPCPKDDDACPFQESWTPATPDTPAAEIPARGPILRRPVLGQSPRAAFAGVRDACYRARQIAGRDDV
jgi:hypothetical protein